MKLEHIVKTRMVRLFIILTLFFLLIVPHVLPDIYFQSRKRVDVDASGSLFNPICQNEINQEIYIEGRISNLSIPLVIIGENNYSGTITVRINQNEIVVEETVPISQIMQNQNVLNIGLSLSQFQKGSAVVTVWSTGLSYNSQVYILTSPTLVSGLPTAFIDGDSLNGPMVLSYNIFIYNRYFYHNTILFLLLIIVIVVTAYLMTYKEVFLGKRNVLFWCSFATIFLFICIVHPTAGLLGEPKSEATYEFWYKADQLGFFRSLMTLMSGYALSWLERILIWVANILSPSNKNIFTIAQVMVLSFISAVVSMPSLKSFEKYFTNEVRFVFCFFIGALIVERPIYWFFTTSYWGIFFFIGFALIDMKKMKAWLYYSALILTIVLCFSRIFYAPLIIVSIFLLLTIGKQLGNRFKIYCYTVFIFALLNALYSARFAGSDMQSANFVENFMNIGLFQIINNTVYYQVQVIQSILFGPIVQHFNGFSGNIIILLFLIILAVYSIFLLFTNKSERLFASAILSYIAIGMGTIMIVIIVSGSWDRIAFQQNFADNINWRQTHYQDANQHFIIAYVAMLFMFATLLYRIKIKIIPYISAIYIMLKKENKLFYYLANIPLKIGTIFFILIIIFLGSLPSRNFMPTYHIATQWRSVYQITHREFAYHLPVNRWWPFEWIGLWHNSQAKNFAFQNIGEGEPVFAVVNPGGLPYITDILYCTAVLGDISNLEDRYVLSLGVRRAITNFDTTMYAVFHDRKGNELATIKQAETPDRLWLTFIFEEEGRPFGYPDIYSVSFYFENGHPAFVQGLLQFGVSMFVHVR
ncbi:MAG: hypothetical protein FWE90_11330 [Defluviitaleaceae bacterium]|nr:hypothetical protein [Defluviitaleaceae bacterium]